MNVLDSLPCTNWQKTFRRHRMIKDLISALPRALLPQVSSSRFPRRERPPSRIRVGEALRLRSLPLTALAFLPYPNLPESWIAYIFSTRPRNPTHTTMFIRNTALLALGASAVVASPLNKRQASSVVSSVASSASSAASSAVSSVTGSASSAAEGVTGSAAATGSSASSSTAVSPSSGAESATSALGSAVSSAATGTSSAPLPTATSMSVGAIDTAYILTLYF